MLVVRRLRLIALALVLSLLVASCAGGGDSPGEADGSSGNSSSSSTAAKDLPPAEIKVNPAKGTKGVMPDDEINVQVMRGTLTDVQVTGAGRAVEGEIDGQSWTSTQRLAPDTTYTVAVTADGPEGGSTTQKSTFTTHAPEVTATYGIVYDQQTVGVGMPVSIQFDSEVTDGRELVPARVIGFTAATATSPDRCVFYTSGRTANETAFMYQLLARSIGTNNLPDCSNMCHESSGAALGASIGIGKGSVTVPDLEAADLILIAGQNPGTNHPRMLATLEKAKHNGARIVAINPLPEAGLMRFKDPQKVGGVIGAGTKLADDFLQVRLGSDMALFRGVARLLRDAERAAPGRDGCSARAHGRHDRRLPPAARAPGRPPRPARVHVRVRRGPHGAAQVRGGRAAARAAVVVAAATARGREKRGRGDAGDCHRARLHSHGGPPTSSRRERRV